MGSMLVYVFREYRDTEGGHGQGACRPRSFFYVPLSVIETAPHPRKIHGLQGREINFNNTYILLLTTASGRSGKRSYIVRIYQSLIRSLLEYACPVWHCALPRSLADKLESLQRRTLAADRSARLLLQ